MVMLLPRFPGRAEAIGEKNKGA